MVNKPLGSFACDPGSCLANRVYIQFPIEAMTALPTYDFLGRSGIHKCDLFFGGVISLDTVLSWHVWRAASVAIELSITSYIWINHHVDGFGYGQNHTRMDSCPYHN